MPHPLFTVCHACSPFNCMPQPNQPAQLFPAAGPAGLPRRPEAAPAAVVLQPRRASNCISCFLASSHSPPALFSQLPRAEPAAFCSPVTFPASTALAVLRLVCGVGLCGGSCSMTPIGFMAGPRHLHCFITRTRGARAALCMPRALEGAPASPSRNGMAAAQGPHLRGSLLFILVLLAAGASGYWALLRSLPPLKVLAVSGLPQRACNCNGGF